MPLTEKGEEILHHMKETYGSEKKAEQVLYASKNAGTITGIDSSDNVDPMAKEVLEGEQRGETSAYGNRDYMQVGVSLADVNRMGRELWGGNDGNVGSVEGSASTLPTDDTGSSPIKVYPGMQDAFDEVSPTQSDPEDKRSDNLLTREHGGIPGTE